MINAKALAELFFNKIIYRFNYLNNIINDRGLVFINNFWLKIYFYLKIKRRFSTAFYL